MTAQQGDLVTLADLLDETAESEQDEEILSRIKTLAQEHLPDGWTRWQVCLISKEEVFGDNLDPSMFNKLSFALPTVGLVRAFDPGADHLSEKAYRQIRHKLLDWAFTRALIIGPPAIANKIRGSAARTELFKESVKALNPLLHTRGEADRILSGCLSESEESSRGRRSTSISSEPPKKRKKIVSDTHSSSQEERFKSLENRMENMFSLLLEKIENRNQGSEEDYGSEGSASSADDFDEWKAPEFADIEQQDVPGIEFLPKVKEADPPVPEPTPQLRKEGISCQRFGSEGWSRIRYKDVEKQLQAAPVFSALKVNPELVGVSPPSSWLTKQDGVLGTITHGLLLQRKSLAEALNAIMKKCPEASDEIRKLIAEGSDLSNISDQILQYVCAHRAETIETRRKAFKPKNDMLTAALNAIPPSATHLFEEKQFSSLVRENGGAAQVFSVDKKGNRGKSPFRKPTAPSRPRGTGRRSNWHPRQSPQASSSRPSNPKYSPNPKPSTSKQSFRRAEKERKNFRKY